ncbi:MAG: tRNA (adenosine(37)-N6)-dimethylallyltransferase MiaA [Bacteroidota bacterium]
MTDTPLVIVVVGPTAVGKTKVAIQIAQQFQTEIISADSRQFYRQLQIGTAKPSPAELNLVKHHFIGNLDIEQDYNISKYEVEALQCADVLFKTHHSIVLVGGSGLYIDAFCKGIDVLPDPDLQLRSELKEKLINQGIESLRLDLKTLDPDYYATVDLANPNRIMRALEVILQTGTPYSQLRKQQKAPRSFKVCKIGLMLPREEIHDLINHRVDIMMRNGILKEAGQLFPHRHLNALNTVGYKELFSYLEGNIPLLKAKEAIKTNTRRYAKRQLTWFHKDKEIRWFSPFDLENIFNYIKEFD